jgi:GTP-binding protein
LSVPVGTLVFEQADDELRLIADLVTEGQRACVAAGGRGGRGNAAFATSTNRAPRRTEPGLAGEIKNLKLQLKLLADVGLVGFPNAGKSTLIARISAARPKIADYPFTTLTPNLGVVRLDEDRSFVVADVPGLIEGAHRGLGLGHRFLRHLERTEVLVHLIDLSGTGRDPVSDYETVARELELFSRELSAKVQMVAANKLDAMDEPERLEQLTRHLAARGVAIYPISAVTGQGVIVLLDAMWRALSEARSRAREVSRPALANAAHASD